jgi:HD-GYP domain-containing protein (c-di-GMP phosphodiesterase class II)
LGFDTGLFWYADISFLRSVSENNAAFDNYINYQQERYNGGGYPEGLKGNSIPLGSRIIALAGAYCALTQDRAHRKAMTNEEALKIQLESILKMQDELEN